MRFFVTCAAHLEPLLEKELHSLGLTETRGGFRGVFVDGPEESMYLINYYSRLATRVLMPLKSIRVNEAQDLYEEALNFPWEKYITLDQTFSIDGAIHHRAFRSSLYGVQLIKDGICDRLKRKLGDRPMVQTQDPDIQIHCYLDEKIGVLSIDTSNPPLFKRGWRVASVEAPLQETLAAAICKITKADEKEVICDPCCGSGTLVIEALMQRLTIPSGFYRSEYGFQKFQDYNPEAFEEIKHRFNFDKKPLKVLASDKDPEAIEAARQNLENAGLQNYVELRRVDLASLFFDGPIDLVISNPPFGKRLKIQSNFFNDFKRFLSRLKSKPEVFLLLEKDQVGPHLPLKIKKQHDLASGGLELKLVEIDY